MRRYRITVQGRSYEVEVLGDPSQPAVQVRVDGELLELQVEDLETASMPAAISVAEKDVLPVALAPRPATPPAATANGQLTAPLPGTIVQVHVQAGQAVQAGDELLVIEAMKMDNRIRSPRNGRVAAVFIQVGDRIGHGTPLLQWSD
jgi:glutaconyl-CoA/methylmalonyl-CoA decarboxylase subunit gamma